MATFKLDKSEIKKIIQHKNFSVVVIGGLFLLFLIDILFIFMPQIRAFRNAGSEIAQMKQKISMGERELMDIEKLRENLQKITSEILLEEQSFTSEDDFELLIEEISKTASDSGVKIIQIRPVRDKEEKSLRKGDTEVLIKSPIQIQAVSNYHSLGKFINKLEEADKFFRIEELEINADSSDYKKSNVSMTAVSILKAVQ